MLLHLDIYNCDKLNLFRTEHHSGEVADVEDQFDIWINQRGLFSVEKVLNISSPIFFQCFYLSLYIYPSLNNNLNL